MVDEPATDVRPGSAVHAFLAVPEIHGEAYVKVVFTGRDDDNAWLWELRSWHALCQPPKSTCLAHILHRRMKAWRKLHADLFPKAEGAIIQHEGTHYRQVAKGPEEL